MGCVVGLCFFCSNVFSLPLVSFSSVDCLGLLFPYHLSKKVCLLCPPIAYIQGMLGWYFLCLRGLGLGKELLKIIEKKKVKSLTICVCLDPGGLWGFADPGSLGMALAARPEQSLQKAEAFQAAMLLPPLWKCRGLSLGPQRLQRYGNSQPSGSLSLGSNPLPVWSPQIETT